MKIKTDENEYSNIDISVHDLDKNDSLLDLDRQHQKDDKIVLHRIKKFCFCTGAFVCCAYVVVWLWHILTPHSWRWLSVDETLNLQNVSLYILTGVVSALVSSYFFKK